jgi:hypothetical protein
MILHLITLPSFSRIVSASASAPKHKTKLNARVTRKNLDFKNILPPKDFKYSGLNGVEFATVQRDVLTKPFSGKVAFKTNCRNYFES